MGIFDFLSELPTRNELTGSIGEWLTTFYSKTLPGALVLHDVLIDGKDDHTSEAKIYGDTRKSTWYYYKHGKKYEIYSPLHQNRKHVEYLENFLSSFGDIPFFSIITMICDDFKISGELDGCTVICNSLSSMRRGMRQMTEDKPKVIDDAQKQAIFDYIQNNQHIGKEARKSHKQQVISYKDQLDELEKQNLCPYCKTELVLRKGKNGEFYGCRNYPKCRFTRKK